jgi:hypothetical protein
MVVTKSELSVWRRWWTRSNWVRSRNTTLLGPSMWSQSAGGSSTKARKISLPAPDCQADRFAVWNEVVAECGD